MVKFSGEASGEVVNGQRGRCLQLRLQARRLFESSFVGVSASRPNPSALAGEDRTIPLYVITDARTVFDAMETRSTVSDRRVAIDMTTLRESIAEVTGSCARCLPGPVQPGDELTKFGHNGALSALATSGNICLVETQQMRDERASLRARVKARKEEAKL